jgi:hypothetical protein
MMELAADILKHNLVEYNVNNFFATVNQQPLVHHEGWMIKWSGNSFLLYSSSLPNHSG